LIAVVSFTGIAPLNLVFGRLIVADIAPLPNHLGAAPIQTGSKWGRHPVNSPVDSREKGKKKLDRPGKKCHTGNVIEAALLS
jgi:hypothetical protein